MHPSAILPHVLLAQHGHPSQIQRPPFLTIDQNSLSVKSPYPHGYISLPHMAQPSLSPDLSISPTHRGSLHSRDDSPGTIPPSYSQAILSAVHIPISPYAIYSFLPYIPHRYPLSFHPHLSAPLSIYLSVLLSTPDSS